MQFKQIHIHIPKFQSKNVMGKENADNDKAISPIVRVFLGIRLCYELMRLIKMPVK